MIVDECTIIGPLCVFAKIIKRKITFIPYAKMPKCYAMKIGEWMSVHALFFLLLRKL